MSTKVKLKVCMAKPVKQSAKRLSTSRKDMLRMSATARMIRIKISETPKVDD